MIKIKTTKKIDVSAYSDKEAELKKLVFHNVNYGHNPKTDKFNLSFVESKIEKENVEVEVPKLDQNGDFMFNENGQIFETELRDEVKFLRNVNTTLPRDVYYTIADQVMQGAGSLTRKQQDDLIVATGIKLYIVQNGFYQGKLTMTDFE